MKELQTMQALIDAVALLHKARLILFNHPNIPQTGRLVVEVVAGATPEQAPPQLLIECKGARYPIHLVVSPDTDKYQDQRAYSLGVPFDLDLLPVSFDVPEPFVHVRREK